MSKKITLLTKQFVLVILTIFSIEGVAMSFFQKEEKEVVLCSPMEGRITFQGAPVKGAKLERLLVWKDDVGEKDYVTTDANGYFSFPKREETVELSPIAEFVVMQEIRVILNGREYPIWAKAKRDKGIYQELGGKPSNMHCEITDDLLTVEQGRGTLVTPCKWDSIKEYKE